MTHINLFCEVFFSSWLTSSFASWLSFISFSVIKDGFNIKTFCDLCTIIKTVFKHHRIIPVLFRDKSCSLYILPSNSSCIYPNKPIWHYWYQNYIIIQSFFPMYCDVNCQTRLVKTYFYLPVCSITSECDKVMYSYICCNKQTTGKTESRLDWKFVVVFLFLSHIGRRCSVPHIAL